MLLNVYDGSLAAQVSSRDTSPLRHFIKQVARRSRVLAPANKWSFFLAPNLGEGEEERCASAMSDEMVSGSKAEHMSLLGEFSVSSLSCCKSIGWESAKIGILSLRVRSAMRIFY